MIRDIKSTISIAATVTPNVVNNDTDGTGVGVDLRGYDSAAVAFHVGVSGDTLSGSVLLTPKVQESADNSSWSDVAAGDLDGTLTVIDDAAEDDAVQVVGYRGTKRYIRAVIDTTGTHTNGTPCSAVVIRSHPKVAPTT